MARKRPTFDTVREMGLALPGVEEGTAYRSPALKVGGRMFACMAIHRSAETDSLAVRMDFTERDALIERDPRVFYLTPHYVDYPVVLIRLTKVRFDTLRDVLRTGWRFESSRAKRPRARRSR